MPEQVFQCRVCLPTDSETAILGALEEAFPSMQWAEGDSSWDKVRVWGEDRDRKIRIYRYESPGPFLLTITLNSGGEAESLALRSEVLAALGGVVWKPLEPQPVELVRPGGRFPDAYTFECHLNMWQIKRVLDDAEFWYWAPQRDAVH